MGKRMVGIDQPSLRISWSSFGWTRKDDYSHHEGDDDSRLVLGQQEGSGHLGDHVTGVEERDTGALNVSKPLSQRRQVH